MAKAKRTKRKPQGDHGPGMDARLRVLEPRARSSTGQVVTTGARVLYPTPLHWYAARRYLTPRQVGIGIRFSVLWFAAGLTPTLVAQYGERQPKAGGPEEALAGRVTARDTVLALLRALSPPEASVVVDVCGAGDFAGGAQRMGDLRRGLDKMARQEWITHCEIIA